MVFQNYALYPHMTVYKNIAFALKVRKLPRDEIRRRVEEAARILGLSEQLERKPAQLSGGQRQRVAMGRAIVRAPQAFLMDEPLSNLDAKLRVQMRGEIGRIQRELETTTIYVTHDQVEAMTMGHRVAVMRKGELQQVDVPQRLYDHPANLFVASFIGSPEMNLVQARLERSADGLVCRIGDQALAVPDDAARVRPALGALRRPRDRGRHPSRAPRGRCNRGRGQCRAAAREGRHHRAPRLGAARAPGGRRGARRDGGGARGGRRR